MIKRHRETKNPNTMTTDELHRKLRRVHKNVCSRIGCCANRIRNMALQR
jgi:hypothetical protein